MDAAENRLVATLPRRDREALLAVCEPIRLMPGEVLCERGERTRHVYFPTTSQISLVAKIDHHPELEVGKLGNEGMLGVHLVLSVQTIPLRALVQAEGLALRITGSAFQHELARGTALRGQMHRYLQVFVDQLAVATGCQRFHLIGPRLARCLLMSQDRAHGGPFRMTHEHLAQLMGVRRVGITTAAGLLQNKGLIAYHRGEVTVTNRRGLEGAACSCYAADQKSYADLMR